MQLETLITTSGSSSTSGTRESSVTGPLMRGFFASGKRLIPFLVGSLMTVNFLILWAIPIAGMGQTWKWLLKPVLLPIYQMLDESTVLRAFAENYIYTQKKHADFFVTSLLTVLNFLVGISIMFYYQLTTDGLPYWLIFAYYCSWVGTGGRIMGAAYALAHKEGHNNNLYRHWIRDSVGNLFENVLGQFYGNVPWNFTTSHVKIHHGLNGGVGDTFYQWDLNRSSIGDFMLYVTRIFLHMTGYSSLGYFKGHNQKEQAEKLTKGVTRYVTTGLLILIATRSVSFVFWVYFQPLLCMSYFLALLNFGFHGFVEFDEQGKSIQCVNSTTIIEGDDDYFGEDDHMAHHYNTTVYFRDLAELQKSKEAEFAKYKASVFRGLSIVELSIYVVLGVWDRLADHYVDYSKSLSKEQIMAMLKARAERLETSFDRYQAYLENPTKEARDAYQLSDSKKAN